MQACSEQTRARLPMRTVIEMSGVWVILASISLTARGSTAGGSLSNGPNILRMSRSTPDCARWLSADISGLSGLSKSNYDLTLFSGGTHV